MLEEGAGISLRACSEIWADQVAQHAKIVKQFVERCSDVSATDAKVLNLKFHSAKGQQT